MLPQPVITPSSFMTERSASAPWPPQSPLPALGQDGSALLHGAWLAGRERHSSLQNKTNNRAKGAEPARHLREISPHMGIFQRWVQRSGCQHLCARGSCWSTGGGLARGEAAEWVMPCKHSCLFAKILCRAGEQGRDWLQPSAHPSFTFPALSLPAAGVAKKSRIGPQAGAPLEPPRVRPRSHGSHGFGVCLLCFAGLTWLHLQNAVMSEHPPF